jgi:Zn-dependent peptidase ImmA (M78 family)
MTRVALGNSQSAGYDDAVEQEIGARVRARMNEVLPGTAQADIAKRLGMAPDAFSRSLNGKRAFTAVELVELGAMLQTSAHWFVTGEPDPFGMRFAGRHTYDHDRKTHLPVDWDSEHALLANIALAYQQVDDAGVAPVGRGLTAAVVRERLLKAGGDDFIRGLADLVEQVFAIDVVRVRDAKRAYVLEVGARTVIVIEETPNWFRENWSIAHEVGHVMAGDLAKLGEEACDDPQAERRANAFAAALLLPEGVVRQVDWQRASQAAVARFVWSSGISTEAVRARLGSLKLTAGPDAQRALGMKTQALLRDAGVPADQHELTERMQDASQRRFPARLVAQHLAAVSEGRLSAATVAWMLGVEPGPIEEDLSPDLAEPDLDWLGRELGLTE